MHRVRTIKGTFGFYFEKKIVRENSDMSGNLGPTQMWQPREKFEYR